MASVKEKPSRSESRRKAKAKQEQPPEHSAVCRENATREDLEVRWGILSRSMQANVPVHNPDRWEIASTVHETRDAKGDEDEPLDRDELLQALSYLQSLPKHRAKKLLGGWSPEALTVGREASLEAFRDWPLYPVLCLRTSAFDIRRPSAQFEEYPDDDCRLVRLLIGVGSNKGDVLEAIEWMRMTIDHDWEHLIAEGEVPEVRANAAAPAATESTRTEGSFPTGW